MSYLVITKPKELAANHFAEIYSWFSLNLGDIYQSHF